MVITSAGAGVLWSYPKDQIHRASPSAKVASPQRSMPPRFTATGIALMASVFTLICCWPAVDTRQLPSVTARVAPEESLSAATTPAAYLLSELEHRSARFKSPECCAPRCFVTAALASSGNSIGGYMALPMKPPLTKTSQWSSVKMIR